MFAAIRRASSRVRSFAADRRRELAAADLFELPCFVVADEVAQRRW